MPLDELRSALGPAADVVHGGLEQAAGADVVVVFVNTDLQYDGEGADRRTLALAAGQDELVAALAATGTPVVVVVASPDAVVMPWRDDVGAILATFLAGQGAGRAIADVLTGAAEPAGRLTTTFPARIEDIPGWLTYPGENGRHVYSEGVHVGYRSYASLGREPLYPFGHGLGYTTFDLGQVTAVSSGDAITLTVPVRNTGSRRGRETVQIYAHHLTPRVRRPRLELVAFAGVDLEPGQAAEVRLRVPLDDLRFWDTARQAWVLDDGAVRLHAGRSSGDLVSWAEVTTQASAPRHRPVLRDTQPVFILDNPPARAATVRFLARTLERSPEDVDRLLDYCRDSFIGIVATLERRFRISFTDQQTEELLAAIRREA